MVPGLIDVGLGILIGLSLGLLGGGGSILTVPALVYVVGQSPQAAVSASLAIVGVNSLLGATFHRLQGTLDWRVALTFGGAGMLASYSAAGLSKQLSPALLLITFALLMLVIGGMMLRRRATASHGPDQMRSLPVILASGSGVGLLTGVLGVGGGFLIVPALVFLVGLPMQRAVGTSLVVIAMNSFAGLLGHLGAGTLDMALILVFIAAGLLGTLVGTRLSRRVSPVQLGRLFGVFVIGLGLFLLVDNLPKLLR